MTGRVSNSANQDHRPSKRRRAAGPAEARFPARHEVDRWSIDGRSIGRSFGESFVAVAVPQIASDRMRGAVSRSAEADHVRGGPAAPCGRGIQTRPVAGHPRGQISPPTLAVGPWWQLRRPRGKSDTNPGREGGGSLSVRFPVADHVSAEDTDIAVRQGGIASPAVRPWGATGHWATMLSAAVCWRNGSSHSGRAARTLTVPAPVAGRRKRRPVTGPVAA